MTQTAITWLTLSLHAGVCAKVGERDKLEHLWRLPPAAVHLGGVALNGEGRACAASAAACRGDGGAQRARRGEHAVITGQVHVRRRHEGGRLSRISTAIGQREAPVALGIATTSAKGVVEVTRLACPPSETVPSTQARLEHSRDLPRFAGELSRAS
jgi:hypothetical protein